MSDIRGALKLLPPCASTGIGSLPHTQLELGLQMALQVDVPYLPQLPAGHPSELMIASAVERLPGMSFDGEGSVSVDLSEWEVRREGFGLEIETALQSEGLLDFEPSAEACRAWRPFLWEVENRKLAWAKVQLAGPATVRWVVKTSKGEPVSAVPALDQQIFRLLLARSVAMVKAVRAAGATPILYLDEPGLYALDRRDPRHLMVLQELKILTLALRREGALVGLHCCSNTDWSLILGLGLDLLSIDVRLSLDAVLDQPGLLSQFLLSGSTLSLGIIPTNLGSTFQVDELVDAVEVSFRAALPRSLPWAEALARTVLTPACGLGMRTVGDAEMIFNQLHQAQRTLRRVVEAENAGAGAPATGASA